MSFHAVHWHNEMFIRPHHFQASHRYLLDLSRRNHNWDVHYNWGIRSLDIDLAALANQHLVIQSLEARLPDGAPIVIPRDGMPPRIDLRKNTYAKDARRLIVYLAIPALRPGRVNVAADRNAEFRFHLDTVTLEDENTGGNPQAIQMRALNLQLLLGEQDRSGYQVLPIARLEKSDKPDGGLQIDETFIPPLLSCDASTPLSKGILGAIHDRVDKKIDALGLLIERQGITLDRQMPGDVLVLKQLQQLYTASTVLTQLRATPGVHPLDLYVELSRLVGQLAIFGINRRSPELPQYDHDDLGTSFAKLKAILDGQLNRIGEPEYQERSFIGAGWRMQVSLEPAWLEPTARVYVGVQSSLPVEESVRLLTQAGQLDMKLGSSDRVEDLFRQGAPGLKFTHEPLPPQELPKLPGQGYFQVIADPKNPEWLNVKRTLTLALRLNENFIVGAIQNQPRLTIKVGSRQVAMAFSLYVLMKK